MEVVVAQRRRAADTGAGWEQLRDVVEEFVEHLPAGRVADPQPGPAVECLDEAEAGRLACARISPAGLAEVEDMHARMRAHFLRGELPEYFALNQAIHEAILRAAANPVLLSTYVSLSGRIARARYMANRLSEDRWEAAMNEHDAILDALARRDGTGLAALLARHLRNKRDIIAGAVAAP